MMRLKCVCVLETMWGTSGRAPGFFVINPNNHSGKRLYKLTGLKRLYVTNACKEQVYGPNQHGTPDPVWLLSNLNRVDIGLLILCGRVAQKTYDQCGHIHKRNTVRILHPAARMWTSDQLSKTGYLIKTLLKGC